MQNKYVVMNENTLGYIIDNRTDGFQYIGILHASILKGSTFDRLQGTALIHPSDTIRPATLQDFEDYRVCSKGHIS